jgi:hypothetical protein
MKRLLPWLSWLSLVVVIVPPLLYLAGSLDKETMKHAMLFGTIGWFATVPWWMGRGGE